MDMWVIGDSCKNYHDLSQSTNAFFLWHPRTYIRRRGGSSLWYGLTPSCVNCINNVPIHACCPRCCAVIILYITEYVIVFLCSKYAHHIYLIFITLKVISITTYRILDRLCRCMTLMYVNIEALS